MKSRAFWAAVALGLSALISGSACSAGPAAQTPMVPFESFFAPAEFTAPLVSPDGKWVSYVGRFQDAFNLFVAPIGDIAKAKPVTREQGRGIQWYSVSGAVTYRWTADSRYLLYLKDNNGDEHNRVYAVERATGKLTNLTPGNVRAKLLGVSQSQPSKVLVSIDGDFLSESMSLVTGSDIVEVDLVTGERRTLMKKIPYGIVVADNDLKVRLVGALTPSMGIAFSTLQADGTTKPFYTIEAADMAGLSATGETDSLRISADNRTLYMLDSVGSDTVTVAGFDLETGAKTIIARDKRVDIRDVLFDPRTRAVQAYGVNWTMLEWKTLDPSIADDLTFLRKAHSGEIHVSSRSADDRMWLVNFVEADRPDAFYAYDSRKKTLAKLFVTTPALANLPLVKMRPYVMKTRDGLELVGYYALPFSADPKQTGKPAKPAPMVVYVHGGPSDERPQYGYAPMVQYFANRGYGFLYVNFRGGAGFGKAFLAGANMEWGGKMHDDVLDQVRWAVEQGIADPNKVAILGGSYGGYESLIGMTKSSDVFACGVAIVGPSDLTVPMPHWSADWMAKVMGDPRTPEGQAMLKTRSPYYLAGGATKPILIGQGDRDSRVPTAQSDKMVQAMQKAGAPVVYLRFADEGHGFLRPQNNAAFWSTTEAFLGKCLGGRSEPLTADRFKGSSVILGAGGDYLPGLEAAIAASQAKP
jgi:dipeptidyl aminopeptidase/acylaminoacyl peptidase